MESISLGGRTVAGFSLGEVGVGATDGSGGVFVPAWLAGAGTGAGVAALARHLGAPTWGIACVPRTLVGGCVASRHPSSSNAPVAPASPRGTGLHKRHRNGNRDVGGDSIGG